jgi:hypothetical protein
VEIDPSKLGAAGMTFLSAGGQPESGGDGHHYGASGVLGSLAGTKPDLLTDFKVIGGQGNSPDQAGGTGSLTPDPQKGQGGPAPTLDDGKNTVAGTFKPRH